MKLLVPSVTYSSIQRGLQKRKEVTGSHPARGQLGTLGLHRPTVLPTPQKTIFDMRNKFVEEVLQERVWIHTQVSEG